MSWLIDKFNKIGERLNKGWVGRTVDKIMTDPDSGERFLTGVLLLGGFGILCCLLWFYSMLKEGMPLGWIIFDSAVILFCGWAVIKMIPMAKDCYRMMDEKRDALEGRPSTEQDEEMEWQDIWHGPYRYDHYGYIWDFENVMVFSAEDLTYENQITINALCGDIVAILNTGEDAVVKWPDLEIREGCDLWQGDQQLGSFRGWGHLTGGLKLTPERAADLQDQLISYVMKRLKA